MRRVLVFAYVCKVIFSCKNKEHEDSVSEWLDNLFKKNQLSELDYVDLKSRLFNF